LTNDKPEIKLESMDRAPSTKRSSTIFLQVVIVLIGIGALALMLWEPHLEGRNAHATLFEIYFKDPFLAYAYLASVAFFVALFQAFRLLGYIGQNNVFSLDSVRALRTIKYCAMALVAMIGAAVAYLFIVVRGKDDIAGGVAMGLLMMFISVVIGAAAAVFERLLQNAVDMKSENDLTV
jgi:di/tricarboxylate transporter